MRTRLPIADRYRRWSYLQDVDLWISELPGRRRREILRDLRTNLADASTDGGMTAALEDLGPARTLAREYLDAEPVRGPIWYQGVVAGLAVVVLSVAGLVTYTLGMLDTLLSTGADTADGSFLTVQIRAESSDTALGAEFHGFAWPVLVLAVLAWLLGARAWRLLTRRRRQVAV